MEFNYHWNGRVRRSYASALLMLLALLCAGQRLHAQAGARQEPPADPTHRVYLPLVGDVAPLPVTETPPMLRVVGWNVQSGGSDPATIASQIAAFEDVDLWGLAEVGGPASASLYAQAAADGEGAPYYAVLGTTGGSDQLLILYDANRFALRGIHELKALNYQDRVRAPLYAHLHDRISATDLIFMVNHLISGNPEGQNFQADGLRAWAEQQWLPVVAAGDFNFVWHVAGGDENHDEGYDRLTRDGVWAWVRPLHLVATFCPLWPCDDGWVVDYVFVAGAAKEWSAASTIVVRPEDFPDTPQTSDHRPVMVDFTLPAP